jgi:hypothetical protein
MCVRLPATVECERYTLHREGSKAVLLSVVPDAAYAGVMWRVKFRDDSLSDMANLTRTKDAGLELALKALNDKSDGRKTLREGLHIRSKENPAPELGQLEMNAHAR